MKYANLFERLLANTVESAGRFNGTPCLCWTGPRTRAYGKVNVWAEGRTVTKQVHRVMAELAVRRAENERLRAALQEIASGCMNLRPGHVDAGNNRTKPEIETIARSALACPSSEHQL